MKRNSIRSSTISTNVRRLAPMNRPKFPPIVPSKVDPVMAGISSVQVVEMSSKKTLKQTVVLVRSGTVEGNLLKMLVCALMQPWQYWVGQRELEVVISMLSELHSSGQCFVAHSIESVEFWLLKYSMRAFDTQLSSDTV